MDGVHIGATDVSIAKARCAAQFKRPTRVFSDAYASGATALTALPGLIPFAGGIPFMVDGEMIGAIGASGASPDQDADVATAGAAALVPAAPSSNEAGA